MRIYAFVIGEIPPYVVNHRIVVGTGREFPQLVKKKKNDIFTVCKSIRKESLQIL